MTLDSFDESLSAKMQLKKTNLDAIEIGFLPVQQVADGVRTVLQEEPQDRPVLFELLVHLGQLHLLAGELSISIDRLAPFSLREPLRLHQLYPVKDQSLHLFNFFTLRP